jgi:Zn-dependent protease
MSILSFVGLLLSFIGFFICLSVHEAAHAYVADKLGDPTAKYLGRMTLNPLAHIDIIGTVIVPVFLIISGLPAFGWAKPVLIDIRNFRNPRLGNFLTALAGPMANLIFALILAVIIKFIPAASFLILLVRINVILAIFNLIPIPPLDGSKVWNLILSWESYLTFERIGPFILIAFLIFSNYGGGAIFTLADHISNFLLNMI